MSGVDSQVDFGKEISYGDVRDLCYYLTFNLSGDCDLELSLNGSERYGNIFESKPSNWREIPIKCLSRKLSGRIYKRIPPTRLDFLVVSHLSKGDFLYNGMKFNFSLGQPSDSRSEETRIINEVRLLVGRYVAEEIDSVEL
jgi:hypothetical protein